MVNRTLAVNVKDQIRIGGYEMKDDKENFVLPEGKREPDIKRVEDLLSLLLSEQYHLNIKV